MTHLLPPIFAPDKSYCSEPKVRLSKWSTVFIILHPISFLLPGAGGLNLDPGEDESPRILALGLGPRMSHFYTINSWRISARFWWLLSAILCCLSITGWTGGVVWIASPTVPVFQGSYSLVQVSKSPIAGLGVINQHFSIYSCLHAVLSITSNIYFIVLPFDLALLIVQSTALQGRTPACIWIQTIARF